jgi:predicted nucleotidyltransferase
MSIPQNSAWKTRLVERGFPDRSFDIEFWQEQGDEAIFAAAWELVELAEEISHGRNPTLQRKLLQLLNEFEVEYLIVGEFAVMKYGEPRYTKDLDVWVHNSPQNSARVVGALRKFGAPLEHDGITTETFTGRQLVYQIGIAPVRIDVLTEITGVEFPDAWGKRVASTFFGVPVHFISLDDLVANKQALGRSSDLKDLKQNPKRAKSEE